MTDGRDDFWNYCATCGEHLSLADWPPLVETRSDGGDTIVRSFCDEECLAAWRDTE